MSEISFNRRSALAMAAAAMAAPSALQAQQSVDMKALLEPGPLGEQTMGDPKAPITVIEYASLSCGFCAQFHAVGFKTLKEKYIDTGKVFYMLREFPGDPRAAAGFMLARCAGEGRFFPMVDLLFAQQEAWVRSPRPVEALLGFARQAGFSQERFETCLRDQAVYDGVRSVRERGEKLFGVDSTPTFFINGKKYTGALSPKEVEHIIEPLLKA